MVDPDLIEGNELARQGLRYLIESKVLEVQQTRLMERLASGGSETDEELLARIKEYRIQSGFVASLLEIGEQISSEENSDERR